MSSNQNDTTEEVHIHKRSSDNSESKFLGLLDKQASRIVAIVFVVAAVFWQIIIPIQKMQITLGQLQLDIAEIKGYQTQISQNTNSISIIQEQIKQLQK